MNNWDEIVGDATREFPDPMNDPRRHGVHVPHPDEVKHGIWERNKAAKNQRRKATHDELRQVAVNDRIHSRQERSENIRMRRAASEHTQHFSPNSSRVAWVLIVLAIIFLCIGAMPFIVLGG